MGPTTRSTITSGVLSAALGLAGALAVACTQLNASHCGNQEGDLTCEQRDASTPYCDRCTAVNDGCVGQPVVEPGCGYGVDGASGEPTTGASTSVEPTSTATTDAVDSSGDGGPTCGNAMIEPGEECDGNVLPDGATCESQGHGAGTPACAADCSAVIYSVCREFADCGNNEVGVGEECDGNLGGKSCDDFPNLTGQGLVCTEQCTFDTSDCTVCRENEQSCDDGDACCDPRAECTFTVLMGKRCCVPNGFGGCE